MNKARHFSTPDTPAPHSTDLFQEQMEKLFSVGLAVSSTEQKPFHTQMKAYCGRRLRFAALRFSPHTTSSLHRGQRPSRLLVSLQKEGVALVQQDGRESRIEAGEMFLIDPARPFSIETGEIVTHSVYVEPEGLRNTLPALEGYTARALRCGSGPGGLFRALVDEMFTLGDTLEEATADRIADALPYVLCAALSALPAAAQEVLPSRLRLLHKQRILRYVRDNLRQHDIDARCIAAAVNLSTRYVYELFESEGQPLMKWIWQQRLERCRADLANPALGARSIGELAYQWGFNDMTHFSRAFRLRYAASPREFRASQRVGRASTEPLERQSPP